MLAQNERESGERGFVVDPAEVLPIRARSFVAWRLAQDDVKFFGFKVTFALLWPTLPQRTRKGWGTRFMPMRAGSFSALRPLRMTSRAWFVVTSGLWSH